MGGCVGMLVSGGAEVPAVEEEECITSPEGDPGTGIFSSINAQANRRTRQATIAIKKSSVLFIKRTFPGLEAGRNRQDFTKHIITDNAKNARNRYDAAEKRNMLWLHRKNRNSIEISVDKCAQNGYNMLVRVCG